MRWLAGLVLSLALVTVGVGWYGVWAWDSDGDVRVAPTTIRLPVDGPPLFPFCLVSAYPQHTFHSPIDLCQPPHDRQERIFVLEYTGQIYSLRKQRQHSAKTLVLDLSNEMCPKSGALGLALHPEFGRAESPNRGYFYVFYVVRRGGQAFDRLSRFELAPGRDVVEPASEVVLIEQQDDHEFHNGGCVRFGPDGFLYISVGDEGGSDDEFRSTQQIDRDLFSGILRIDVDCAGGDRSHPIRRQPKRGRTAHYFIPNDNPFTGTPDVLEEFWAIGLRSPHRFSFDRETGQIWCGDTGQSRREEINRIEKGGNYQWCYREGTRKNVDAWLQEKPASAPGNERGPFLEYGHEDGNGCVMGGCVYRSDRLSELNGKYIFGDSKSGRIWALDISRPDGAGQRELLTQVPADLELISFGDDQDGELYIFARSRREESVNSPGIFRLHRDDRPVSASLPRLLSETGIFRDLHTLEPQPGIVPYTVNVPVWSDGAQKRRWMAVPGDGRSEHPDSDRIVFHKWEPWTFPAGTVFVKHFETPIDDGDPTKLRRLETRVLVRNSEGSVYGVTYKWRDDESDAELLDDALDEKLLIRSADGGHREQIWRYPSRRDCLTCHNALAGHVLGVQTAQMNCAGPRSGGCTTNQIRYLNNSDYLTISTDSVQKLGRCQIYFLPSYAPPDDPHAGLEKRARSYLAANCAYCHQDSWYLDFRYTTDANVFLYATLRDDLGVRGARSIKPGSPEQSLVYLRVNSSDPSHQMPPIGRTTVDPSAARLLNSWISSMQDGEN